MDELTPLVIRAQAGDLDAYGTIVVRVQDMAVGYACAILNDFHTAEDAAQEAFIQAYRDLPKLHTPGAFPGWFRTIVFRCCTRLTRGKSVETIPLDTAAEMMSHNPGPDEIVEAHEMKNRVLHAIRALSEQERTVTTLFYINGYSQEEISTFLEVPVKTVKSRLHTARKKLRERMIDMVKDTLKKRAPSRDSAFRERVRRMIQPEAMKTPTYIYGVESINGDEAWALMQACVAGDLAQVKALLHKDPRLVNAQFWYEFPIHQAVRHGHPAVVRVLLDVGADPGQSRYTYNSWNKLLAIAKERGYDEVYTLLVETLKHRVHYAPEFDELKEAIIAQDQGAIERIIRDKPELTRAADALGNTALHWAVMTRQLGLIDYFLDRGADLEARRADGQTPLQLSVNGDYWFGHRVRDEHLSVPVIRNPWVVTGYLLAKGADYPISMAAAIGDRKRVEELLARDPGLARRLDSARHSPLAYAAREGYDHIVRLLLEHGADPNMPEDLAPRGRALFAASAGNHLETAKLLLEHGANPNAGVDSSGTCVTIVEVKHPNDCQAMQNLLRQYGAVTPPWCMSEEEMKQALEADHQIVHDPEFLPNLMAKEDETLIDLLLEKDPAFPARLHGGVRWIGGVTPRSVAIARKLLAHGLDPNRRDWIGKTFLHTCAEQGYQDVAAVLLEAGADINAIELEYGETPLGTAARTGQVEMVRFLLERGAEHQLADGPWASPLVQAERAGHSEIVEILRKHGATA